MRASQVARLREVIEPFERARPLPGWAFVDQEMFSVERERIFAAHPVPIGHVTDVPRPGDWVRAPLLGERAIVTHGADLELHALQAVCSHRGTLLCEGARGRFERLEIVCPYHGLAYSTNGDLLRAPGFSRARWADMGLAKNALAKTPIGVLFAVPSRGREPAAIALPPFLSRIKPQTLVRARRVEYQVRANWKAIVGNFQESHHFPLVHPGLEARTPWNLSKSVGGDGWLGGEMPLLDGCETVSESGSFSGRTPIVAEPHRDRVFDALVFPLFLTSLQPDYLLTYRLTPLAVDATSIVFEIHLHEESLARGDTGDVFRFWDRTNAEDKRICELQQSGLDSDLPGPSFYAESEDGLHAFEAMVAATLLEGECA